MRRTSLWTGRDARAPDGQGQGLLRLIMLAEPTPPFGRPDPSVGPPLP